MRNHDAQECVVDSLLLAPSGRQKSQVGTTSPNPICQMSWRAIGKSVAGRHIERHNEYKKSLTECTDAFDRYIFVCTKVMLQSVRATGCFPPKNPGAFFLDQICRTITTEKCVC